MNPQTRASDLGAENSEAYLRDGVVCIKSIVEEKWLDVLREGTAEVMASPAAHSQTGRNETDGKGLFFAENTLWPRYEKFKNFIDDSQIVEIASQLMGGCDVRLFGDGIFVKEPGTHVPTPWHHDIAYWRVEGLQSCSAWIPLDPVTEATGAVRFVVGSHTDGKIYSPKKFQETEETYSDQFDASVPDIDADPDRYKTVSYDVEPGDAIFFTFRTLHGAGSNTSAAARRRAFVLRMAGADMVWKHREFSTMPVETDLIDGDALRDPYFPRIWPRGELRA